MSVASFLSGVLFGSRHAQARTPRWSARLAVEGLEQRCVPATLVRPIEDFLVNQGTLLVDDTPDTPGGLFVPPAPNYIGWGDPKQLLGVSFDYAGLANGAIEELSGGAISFGTTMDGKVIERSLPDGRTEVHVLLHTSNALTWGIELADVPNPYGTQPLLFGARASDVLDGTGAVPVLGESFLQVRFIHNEPLGGELPDLLQVAFLPEEGEEVLSMSFRGTARGELADGTPMTVQVTQIGLFNTGFKGAVADGYPAEHVRIITRGGNASGGQSGAQGVAGDREAAWLAAVDAVFAQQGKRKERGYDALLGFGW